MDLNEIIIVSTTDINAHNPDKFLKLGSMKTKESELRLKMHFRLS